MKSASRNQLRFHAVSPVDTAVDLAKEEVVRAEDDAVIDRALAALAAIYHLRRKELVHDLDVQPSHLSEAVSTGDEKGKKQLQVRWLPAFIRRCPSELRDELREAFAALFADQDDQLTQDEENEAARLALDECGLAGQRAHEAARQRVLARRRRTRR
jgi:hypothetical protein